MTWASPVTGGWASPDGLTSGGGDVPDTAGPAWVEIDDTVATGALVDPDSLLTSLSYGSGVWTATYAGAALERVGYNDNWPHIVVPLEDIVNSALYNLQTHILELAIKFGTGIGDSNQAGPCLGLSHDTNGATTGICVIELSSNLGCYYQTATASGTIDSAIAKATHKQVTIGQRWTKATQAQIEVGIWTSSDTLETGWYGEVADHGGDGDVVDMSLKVGFVQRNASGPSNTETQTANFYYRVLPRTLNQGPE